MNKQGYGLDKKRDIETQYLRLLFTKFACYTKMQRYFHITKFSKF